MSLRIKLKDIRESKKPRLSLNGLARLTGLSPQHLQQLEVGLSWFSKDSLERICTALNCKPGDLVDLDLNEKTNY